MLLYFYLQQHIFIKKFRKIKNNPNVGTIYFIIETWRKKGGYLNGRVA